MLITDGNTGPSEATPAHLLCHDARDYLEPHQIQADRKTVTIWRKNCPLGETGMVPGMLAHQDITGEPG